MITAEDLTKHFDEFIAVEGIHLDVEAGQVLALLGPNGAGKTTTVRMLTSILRPTRGRAWVNGFDVVAQADKVRASVGVLTEHHGLYARMNAEEYLLFYGDLYGIESRQCWQRIDVLLTQFGLEGVRRKKLGEYSKGMRQKLALVRALIHDPPVLLLDEPTSAMDPESARTVRDAILGLRTSQRTIVLCTHNLSEAEILADQIAIIREGHIILSGSAEEIKKRLLGPEEYEVQLATYSMDGQVGDLPPGVILTSSGDNWLRFQIEDPQVNNPQLLRRLLATQHEVLSFNMVQRSLEDAYLQAVSQKAEMGHDGG
jgi:ABC-2 type transport system ATP-binding protein